MAGFATATTLKKLRDLPLDWQEQRKPPFRHPNYPRT